MAIVSLSSLLKNIYLTEKYQTGRCLSFSKSCEYRLALPRGLESEEEKRDKAAYKAQADSQSATCSVVVVYVESDCLVISRQLER